MFNTVKFSVLALDKLSGVTWSFYLINDRLVLDAYSTWTKETTRHKAVNSASWTRFNGRQNTMARDQVPFTQDVAALAKKTFLENIEKNLIVGFAN